MIEKSPHNPVLLKETVSRLLTNPNGIYLDCTIGYGGHSLAIVKNLTSYGKIIGIDLDPYALDYTERQLAATQASYSLHHENYREYPKLLQNLGIKKLAGMLFDLGSSSSQVDSGHRGFSFRYDAPLDMRFNPGSGISAAEYLNTSDVDEIGSVIYKYSEERYYKKIARSIYQCVKKNEMNTTFDLKRAIEKSVNQRFLTKSLSRVFQAIRIKINDELNSIQESLKSSMQWLEVGGRIAIISFHSLEDRIVKKFFLNNAMSCICPREYPKCICSTVPTLKILNRKPICPDQREVDINSRARSAKLRVAERI
tara:strand:- start:3011 stop:3943 length:933 start_codon:yes stop_codon:yes gene_type:complete